MKEEDRIGRFETFSKQNEITTVIKYLKNELGEDADNLYVLYNDTDQGMFLVTLKNTKAYILQKLISSDHCSLLRRKDYANDTQEKGYIKADYIMALHKEYGCDLKSAEKAHDMALEYLRSLSKMKG